MKKWLIISFILIACLLAILILLSPYGRHKGFHYRLVKHTIEINAPVKDVFNSLGNSKNASRWSVFVHHINPLNTDSVPDGIPEAEEDVFARLMKKGCNGMN